MDTTNLLTTMTTPTQTMNDHRTAAYFKVMTKPYETLFNGTPENWPEFEPPSDRSGKPYYQMEPGNHKLPINGRNI
jgi:hypothetical protein